MAENLYRITVLDKYDDWANKKPIYVIAKTKNQAITYAEEHLRKPFRIGKIIRLASRLGGNMFAG